MYADEKMLGTQPYSTCGSVSIHCVPHPNSIKGFFNRLSTHTHTHTHKHASIIRPKIHINMVHHMAFHTCPNMHLNITFYFIHMRSLIDIHLGMAYPTIHLSISYFISWHNTLHNQGQQPHHQHKIIISHHHKENNIISSSTSIFTMFITKLIIFIKHIMYIIEFIFVFTW